jgi:hypothetical protein
MFTAGATWYSDKARTWELSALGRYEINGPQRDTHITPGDAFTLEWAADRTLFKTTKIGPVGYFQDKVTEDSGAGSLPYRGRVVGIGGEISTVIQPIDLTVSLRYNYEVMSKDRAQGQTVTLSLTQKF